MTQALTQISTAQAAQERHGSPRPASGPIGLNGLPIPVYSREELKDMGYRVARVGNQARVSNLEKWEQHQLDRKTVWDRDPHECVHCHRELHDNVRAGDGLYYTMDHVIPRCEGGDDHPDNYVLACTRCNNERGNMSFEAYQNLCKRRAGMLA